MPIHKAYNREFFKTWSSNMAYILGFLFADGNIIKTKRNTHFVGWYTKDEELLIRIAEVMDSTHKVAERKTEKGSYFVLQIGSRELFDDLQKLGLIPNKAARMLLPDIPPEYVGDFVRGYFDGDGNIWSGIHHKNRINPSTTLMAVFTSVSTEFLTQLSLLLKSKGIVGGSIYKVKNKECSRLLYSMIDSLKLYEIMYNDSTKLFLNRKKLIFEKFIQMRL